MNEQLQEMRHTHPHLEYINDEWMWRCVWTDYTGDEHGHYAATPEGAVSKAYAAWLRSLKQ